jgi:hypothetical protein
MGEPGESEKYNIRGLSSVVLKTKSVRPTL